MQAVTSTRAFTPAVATQRHARRQVTVQALSRPQVGDNMGWWCIGALLSRGGR